MNKSSCPLCGVVYSTPLLNGQKPKTKEHELRLHTEHHIFPVVFHAKLKNIKKGMCRRCHNQIEELIKQEEILLSGVQKRTKLPNSFYEKIYLSFESLKKEIAHVRKCIIVVKRVKSRRRAL